MKLEFKSYIAWFVIDYSSQVISHANNYKLYIRFGGFWLSIDPILGGGRYFKSLIQQPPIPIKNITPGDLL